MSGESQSYSPFERGSEKNSVPSTISQSKKTFLLILFIFLFVIIPMAIIISQSLRVVNLNYQMEQLEKSLSEVQEENREMKRMVTQKRSLDRIEQIAREELNMVEAEHTHRLAVNSEDLSGQKQLAAGAEESDSWLANLWNGFRRAAAAPLE